MRYLLLVLLLTTSCFAADRFRIVDSKVEQILSASEALCTYKGELVLISGLDFTQVADGLTIRSQAHGSFDGNFSYTNALGQRRTVRRISIVDNGRRR